MREIFENQNVGGSSLCTLVKNQSGIGCGRVAKTQVLPVAVSKKWKRRKNNLTWRIDVILLGLQKEVGNFGSSCYRKWYIQ